MNPPKVPGDSAKGPAQDTPMVMIARGDLFGRLSSIQTFLGRVRLVPYAMPSIRVRVDRSGGRCYTRDHQRWRTPAAEIGEVINHMAFYAGWPTAANAVRVAEEVYDAAQ